MRSTRALLALVVVFGVAGSLIVHEVAAEAERRRGQAEFDRLANDRLGVIRSAIDAHVGAVHSLRALFLSSERVDREQFSVFARQLLRRYPGAQALEWIPRVRAGDRPQFEEARRRDGFSGFAIRELGADGLMVPAPERAEYFPVDFVEPWRGNERALGFDLASDRIRSDAIERSRRSATMAGTAGITLVQDPKREQGFLLFAPLIVNDGLVGFVLGVFRVRDVLGAALGDLEQRPIDVFVSDQTDPGKERLLAALTTMDGALPPTGMRDWLREGIIDVADRRWLVQCVAQEGGSFAGDTTAPILMAALGLLLTAFVAFATWGRELAIAAGQREEIQRGFAHRIVEAQERERKALAQELHDGVAQDLAAVALYAQLGESEHEGAPARAFERLYGDIRRSVAELRRLSYGLHPLELEEGGLIGAITELVQRTKAANSKQRLHFEDATGGSFVMDAEASLGVYRTVQEALSNALRHASAANVWISLSCRNGKLHMSVRDDGSGFDATRSTSGLGLRSMRERAAFLAGTLTIESEDTGTRVNLVVPAA